ncbi:MAG TPA: YggT family protein [Gemmatimonadaceae bacterium]
MDDDNATIDEARRNAQHEAIKSHVQRDVNADIQQRSEQPNVAESDRAGQVATDLRRGAIDDVAGKDRELSRGRDLARGSQVVDYVFSVIYGLLAIRLALSLLAARSSNGFVEFIAAVTAPFYAMFRDIVPSPSVSGGYTLVVPIIIAIVVYALLHAAIKAFLRMLAHRKTTI